MMKYKIVIKDQALKQLSFVPKKYYEKIKLRIDELADDPYPYDCKKLKYIDGYRIRVGSYRILYTIDKGIMIIKVIKIKHRKDVYREL